VHRWSPETEARGRWLRKITTVMVEGDHLQLAAVVQHLVVVVIGGGMICTLRMRKGRRRLVLLQMLFLTPHNILFEFDGRYMRDFVTP
jgi:hypothetical protein